MKPINVELSKKTILVTGAAGFIGSNLVKVLLQTVPNVHILGVDNCNDYYDVSLKDHRLEELDHLEKEYPESRWTFVKGNIAGGFAAVACLLFCAGLSILGFYGCLYTTKGTAWLTGKSILWIVGLFKRKERAQ